MKNKFMFLLTALTFSLGSSVLAAGTVTQSNLTGLALPDGAIEVTDTNATTPFNQYLEDVANQLGGSCEYSEFLVWLGGNPKALADALAGPIVDGGYAVKDLDAAAIDDTTNYEQFAMTSSKDNYAAVWVDSPDNVVLGWCNVK